MRAFGYEDNEDVDIDEDPRLIPLREVGLSCSLEDLRRIHRFIVGDVVSEWEAGGLIEPWHEHFRDRNADWTTDESDLIVAPPSQE